MFENSLRGPLILHCAVMSIAHVVIALVLRSRGKFNWVSAGFWAWAISLVIFVVHPLVAVAGDMTTYTVRLQNTSGAPHVYWVLGVLLVALATFFTGYSFAGDGRPSNLREVPPTKPVVAVLTAFAVMGFVSMLAYRVGARGGVDHGVGIDGRFTGDVNGWTYSLQRFVLFPMAYFWIFRPTRSFGMLLLAAYTTIRMFDPDERVTVFVPALALGFVLMSERGRKWPPLWSAGAAGLMLAFLVIRGHVGIQEFDLADATRDLDRRATDLVAGADTDMLPQFYKVSAVFDDRGYSYGMPFAEAALVGYLPRKYFPWKNFLSERVGFNPWNDVRWCRYVAGPKSPLIGETYYWGGVLAVLILCPLFGYLLRKIDGMTAADRPRVVRALGFTYLSFTFMFYISAPEWVLQYVAVTAIPFFGAMLTARFFGLGRATGARRAPPTAVAPDGGADKRLMFTVVAGIARPARRRLARGLLLRVGQRAGMARPAVSPNVRPQVSRPMCGWRIAGPLAPGAGPSSGPERPAGPGSEVAP